MKIRLAADLQTDSIVDGLGVRTVVWTQGCSHNCPSCHNPSTHDFNGGELVELDEVLTAIEELEGQDGITLSGGDPFFQPASCTKIAQKAHELGMNVWAYTGFTYEDLIKKGNKDILELLMEIDVLIDGKFDPSKKTLDLPFRGSSNQRLIDVKKSLENHETIRFELKTKPKIKNSKEMLYI